MTTEEEVKLAKEKQDKIDQEKLEKELSEAGITLADDNAPVTMKAMIELFGFMKGKMVDEVFTRVINNQNASSSTGVSNVEALVVKDNKDQPKTSEKPPHDVAPPTSYLTQVPPTQPHITNLSRPPPKLDNTRYFTWKKSMESYFRSSSVHLWRVVQIGRAHV